MHDTLYNSCSVAFVTTATIILWAFLLLVAMHNYHYSRLTSGIIELATLFGWLAYKQHILAICLSSLCIYGIHTCTHMVSVPVNLMCGYLLQSDTTHAHTGTHTNTPPRQTNTHTAAEQSCYPISSLTHTHSNGSCCIPVYTPSNYPPTSASALIDQ